MGEPTGTEAPPSADTPPGAEAAGRIGAGYAFGLGAVVTSVHGSSATKSFLRSAATVLGREITRGMLGTARKRRR